ncbi:hypothetical protein HDU76_013128 [Blyttiomyces sp. JEL0837]|nr:hypothetical protein HDU76_013128 [Blyttiomyces sp. JEL0837]
MNGKPKAIHPFFLGGIPKPNVKVQEKTEKTEKAEKRTKASTKSANGATNASQKVDRPTAPSKAKAVKTKAPQIPEAEAQNDEPDGAKFKGVDAFFLTSEQLRLKKMFENSEKLQREQEESARISMEFSKGKSINPFLQAGWKNRTSSLSGSDSSKEDLIVYALLDSLFEKEAPWPSDFNTHVNRELSCGGFSMDHEISTPFKLKQRAETPDYSLQSPISTSLLMVTSSTSGMDCIREDPNLGNHQYGAVEVSMEDLKTFLHQTHGNLLLSSPYQRMLHKLEANLGRDATAISPTSSISMNWTDRYKPQTCEGILGEVNVEAARLVKNWLYNWKSKSNEPSNPAPTKNDGSKRRMRQRSTCHKRARRSRTRILDDDFILDDDDFEEGITTDSEAEAESSESASASALSELLSGHLRLIGPTGSGRTSAVFAAAAECGYEILEINVGQRRAGKDVSSILSEASKCHSVSVEANNGKNSSLAGGWAAIFSNPAVHSNSDKKETKESQSKKRKGTQGAKNLAPETGHSEDDDEDFVDVVGSDDDEFVLKPARSSDRHTRKQKPKSRRNMVVDDDDDGGDSNGDVDSSTVVMRSNSTSNVAETDQQVSHLEQSIEERITVTSEGSVPEIQTVAGTTSNTSKPVLILVDDADILFEEDKGFWSAIALIMEDDPLIDSNSHIPFNLFPILSDLTRPVIFDSPTVQEIFCYLHILLLIEGIWLPPDSILKMCLRSSKDIRQCIIEAEQCMRQIECAGLVGQVKQPGMDGMFCFVKPDAVGASIFANGRNRMWRWTGAKELTLIDEVNAVVDRKEMIRCCGGSGGGESSYPSPIPSETSSVSWILENWSKVEEIPMCELSPKDLLTVLEALANVMDAGSVSDILFPEYEPSPVDWDDFAHPNQADWLVDVWPTVHHRLINPSNRGFMTFTHLSGSPTMAGWFEALTGRTCRAQIEAALGDKAIPGLSGCVTSDQIGTNCNFGLEERSLSTIRTLRNLVTPDLLRPDSKYTSTRSLIHEVLPYLSTMCREDTLESFRERRKQELDDDDEIYGGLRRSARNSRRSRNIFKRHFDDLLSADDASRIAGSPPLNYSLPFKPVSA